MNCLERLASLSFCNDSLSRLRLVVGGVGGVIKVGNGVVELLFTSPGSSALWQRPSSEGGGVIRPERS